MTRGALASLSVPRSDVLMVQVLSRSRYAPYRRPCPRPLVRKIIRLLARLGLRRIEVYRPTCLIVLSIRSAGSSGASPSARS